VKVNRFRDKGGQSTVTLESSPAKKKTESDIPRMKNGLRVHSVWCRTIFTPSIVRLMVEMTKPLSRQNTSMRLCQRNVCAILEIPRITWWRQKEHFNLRARAYDGVVVQDELKMWSIF
jgi:hypothetical protein